MILHCIVIKVKKKGKDDEETGLPGVYFIWNVKAFNSSIVKRINSTYIKRDAISIPDKFS
ncbi:MAG TPA: hypothetical protein VK498_08605 [Ferruginibacter sp.]|nr:hypothetical protein [Ferruginibacter sp.]